MEVAERVWIPAQEISISLAAVLDLTGLDSHECSSDMLTDVAAWFQAFTQRM